jgi:hypothetical protein
MSDLGGGLYQQYDPIYKFLGRPVLAKMTQNAARSNFQLGGLSLVDNAALGSTKGSFVAIPVQEGDIISKVSVLIGGTEGASLESTIVALYEGAKEGVLLGQSKKVTTTPLVKETVVVLELESEVWITSTNAPNGYIYAGISIKGTTPPTLIGYAAIAAAGVVLPKFAKAAAPGYEATEKSEGVAAAKLSTTALNKVPLVFLQ